MIKLLTRKQIKAIYLRGRERGIDRGYELGWKMKQIEKSNRGFIIGTPQSQMERDIEEILERGKC